LVSGNLNMIVRFRYSLFAFTITWVLHQDL
jgi:hypothetical protein